MHKNCTRNLPQYLQITITPRDSINLIPSLHVYAKTENWKIKKQLVVKKTRHIYILFSFMIFKIHLVTEGFISGLLYNTNRRNTKMGMKGARFLRRSTDK
jgi:hypothetical protein